MAKVSTEYLRGRARKMARDLMCEFGVTKGIRLCNLVREVLRGEKQRRKDLASRRGQ